MKNHLKRQVDELVKWTIAPALEEDFIYDNQLDADQVLEYLKACINKLNAPRFDDDELEVPCMACGRLGCDGSCAK